MSIITSTVYNFDTEFYKVKIDMGRKKCSLEYLHSYKTSYFKAKTKYEITFSKIWLGSFKNHVNIESPKFMFNSKDKYETLLIQVAPNKYIHVYNMVNEFESEEQIYNFYTLPSEYSGVLSYAEAKTYSIMMYNIQKKFSYVNINNVYKKNYKNPFDFIANMKSSDMDLIPKDAIIPYEYLS